jgi:hypothetical protein
LMPVHGLETEDVTVLSGQPGASVLEGMAMWVPFHVGDEPIGALTLGARAGGLPYAEEELDLLQDCADSVASIVHIARLQEQSVDQVDALLKQVRLRELELQRRMRQVLVAEATPLLFAGQSEEEAVSLVEDALRHMHDYAYLGEHPLVRLRAVESFISAPEHGYVTHLDRGKALQELLLAGIEKLRPGMVCLSDLARLLRLGQSQPRGDGRALRQRGHLQPRPPPRCTSGDQSGGGDGETDSAGTARLIRDWQFLAAPAIDLAALLWFTECRTRSVRRSPLPPPPTAE